MGEIIHNGSIPVLTTQLIPQSAVTYSEHLSHIAEFYDSETNNYDNGYSTPLCQAEDQVWVHLVQGMVGSKVADIGCGTGDFLKYFQPIEYAGLDISHQMVKAAQRKYGREFMVANMHDLPLPDDCFDTLVSIYGPMSYSPSPQALIQEFSRVVRPGGSLIVMPYTKRVEKGQRSSELDRKLLTGDYSTAINPYIEKVFYSTAMLRELFAGFDDVRITGINFTANGIECIDQVLQHTLGKKPYPAEFYKNYMLWELDNIHEKDRPVEFARHALVTAKKPGKPYS